MIKKYFIFFCFVFMISFASCASLSMGPQQLNFVGEAGKTICDTAVLKLPGNDFVIGKVLFAEEGYSERKLTQHNLSAEDLGLKVSFPTKVEVVNETSIEVCIDGKSGNYHGIILYKIESKPVQVGVWMNINLSKGSKNSLAKITGNAVSGSGIGGIFALPIILLIVLGLLVLRMKFKK